MIIKRGQVTSAATWFIGSILTVLLISFILLSVANKGDFKSSVSTIQDFSSNVLGPLFGFLLGFNSDSFDHTNQFLIVLTFILMIIIITGTMDSINMFGGSGSTNGLLNLAIGIIVSIIGVRFMPENMWASLTAPSSALVATVLVAIPFVALGFISMKVKSTLARKLLWLFYIIFMSYLIFSQPSTTGGLTTFAWIYITFLILAIIMMFFDSTVRTFFFAEKAKTEIATVLGELGNVERYNIRKEIKENQRIVGDPSANDVDRNQAKAKLKKLTKLYGDLSKV